MKTTIGLVLSLAGALTLGCAAAPPKPNSVSAPPESALAYYPLAVGWKWAYDLEKDGQQILAIYSVLESNADGAIILIGDEHLAYSVSPEGIARRENDRAADFILKSPVTAGAQWAIADGKARILSVGETVTVAAGTFTNCATVEEVRLNPNRLVRTTFAAGIGPISLEYQINDPATGQLQIAMRASLRGVTKPGEDPLGPETVGKHK